MGLQRHVDLKAVREELGMSQTELAEMLCVSPRTVQSCEQGWRNPSPGVERAALLLLLAHRHGGNLRQHECWQLLKCSEEKRSTCLVFQSRQGHLCWLLTGNRCQGKPLRTWSDKKSTCFTCDFFLELLPEGAPVRPVQVSRASAGGGPTDLTAGRPDSF